MLRSLSSESVESFRLWRDDSGEAVADVLRRESVRRSSVEGIVRRSKRIALDCKWFALLFKLFHSISCSEVRRTSSLVDEQLSVCWELAFEIYPAIRKMVVDG